MSKKVLIISASPRIHGNSDLLCDEFARGAMESGNSVEKNFSQQKEDQFLPRLLLLPRSWRWNLRDKR